jgi:outer membrane protein assembly factor BamB
MLSLVLPVTGTQYGYHEAGEQSRSYSESDSWSMFQHDSQHTGYSTAEAPNTNHLLWTFEGESYFYYTSPVVVNDTLYIGSWFTSDSPPNEDLGKVYCVNASTGEPIWEEIVGGIIQSTPAVSNNKVYIGAWDNKLYCLNAKNGSKLWNFTTNGWIDSSPTVSNNNVYVGSYDAKVYCLNADNGSQLWNYTTDGMVMASPAVSSNRVYVGTYGGTVYCLNAENGSLIWMYHTIVSIESSCAVSENRVYVGCGDHSLYCFDAVGNGDGTTTLLWASPTGDIIARSSPAVAYGHVYIASFDGNIYCFDAENGTRLWNQTIGIYLFSSPAVADGKVYIGSSSTNRLYCFDAEIGALLWEYKTGDIYSAPAIFNKRVFIASATPRSMVYAFQDPAQLSIGDITGGLSLSSTIENIGVSDAENLEWHLFVRGGFFSFIDVHITETIPRLKATEILPVEIQQAVVGVGRVTITITATADGLTPIWKQVNGFILGRYIFIVSEGGGL